MTLGTEKRIGFFTRVLDDAEAGDRYRIAVDQIVAAEALGYHGAWLAQHHFDRDEGGLPSPFVLLAYAAARTSRIRLGTGVVTLPLEDALRVAEDAVVLDLLSRGRVELGLGTGGTPETFTAFGRDVEARGRDFGERLALLREALAGRALPGGRRLYPAADGLGGRIWQATFSVEGGRRAGSAGDGLLLSRTQPRPADDPERALHDIQRPIVEAYLAALPTGVAPRILASRSVFVADDRNEALRHAQSGLGRVAERFAARGHRLRGTSLPDLIATFDTHVGTPDDVAASLATDATLDLATDIAIQVHSVDPPAPLVTRSLELFATAVAPALGWTRPASTRAVRVAAR